MSETASGSLRSRTATSILAGLDTVGIRYCVLRNHELIPTEPGRDIDLVAPDTSLPDAESVLKRVAAEEGWRTVLRCRGHHEGTSYYLLRREGHRVLQLEIHFTRVRWAGIPLFDTGEILDKRIKSHNGLWIASPTQIVVQRLLQFGLAGQLLEMKHEYWVETVAQTNVQPEEVTAELAGHLGPKLASRISHLVVMDDRDGVAALLVRGRMAFVARQGLTSSRAGVGLVSKSVDKLAARYRAARCGVVAATPYGRTADTIADALSRMFLGVRVVDGADLGSKSMRNLIGVVNRVGLVLVVTDDPAKVLRSRAWGAPVVQLGNEDVEEAVSAITDRFSKNHLTIG